MDFDLGFDGFEDSNNRKKNSDKVIVYGRYIDEEKGNLDGQIIHAFATTNVKFAKQVLSRKKGLIDKIEHAENLIEQEGIEIKPIYMTPLKEDTTLDQITQWGLPIIYSGRYLDKETCMTYIGFDVAKNFVAKNADKIHDNRIFRRLKDLNPNKEDFRFVFFSQLIAPLFLNLGNEMYFMANLYSIQDFGKDSCIENELNDFTDIASKLSTVPYFVKKFAHTVVEYYDALQKDDFIKAKDYKSRLNVLKNALE